MPRTLLQEHICKLDIDDLKKSPIPGIWFKLAYILTSWNRIYISQHKAEGNRREQSVAEIIYVSYQRKQKQQ